MKKKLLAMILLGTAVGVSAFALGGCSNKNKDKDKGDNPGGDTDITDPDTPLDQGGCKHEGVSHVSAVSAGCVTGGNKEYWYCASCGKYYSDSALTVETSLASVTLGAVGHSYGAWSNGTPADCTTDGEKAHKDCTVCHKHFDAENNEITNLTITAGHNYGEWIAEVPAHGCTDGVHGHYHCDGCGSDFNDKYEEYGSFPWQAGPLKITAPHNIKHYEAEEASCIVDGHDEYWQCEDCETYFDQYGNVAFEEPLFTSGDHDYGEFVYDYTAKKYVKTCKHESTHTVAQAAGTEDYPYLAKDEATLKEAIALGGHIKLENSFETAGNLLCDSALATVIDLNGQTITGTAQVVFWAGYQNNVELIIKNGYIVANHAKGMGVYSTMASVVTLENVEITSVYGIYATKGTFNVVGGKITATGAAIQGYSAKYYAAPTTKPEKFEDYDLVVNISEKAEIEGNAIGINLRSAYLTVDDVKIDTYSTCVVLYRDCNATLTDCSLISKVGCGYQGNGTKLITDTGNKSYYNSGVNTVAVLNNCNIDAAVGIYHPQIDGKMTVNGGSITATQTAVEVRAGEAEIKGVSLTSTSKVFSAAANGSGSTTMGMALAVSQHSTDDNIVVTLSNTTLNGIYALYEKDLMDDKTPKDITITLGEGNTFNGCVYSENCENLSELVGVKQKLISSPEELVAGVEAGGQYKLSSDIDLTTIEAGANTKEYYAMRSDTVLDLNGHKITTKKGFSSGVNDKEVFEADLNPVVTVVNGTVERVSNTNIAALSAADCGELVIVNCTVISTGDTAVSIFDQGKVTVYHSTLKGVYYGFSSNAGKGNYSTAIYAKLVNCKLDAQYAGLMWNIPATLEVENCEIKGIGQAMIARGGTITVSNTTLIKRAGVEGVDSDRAIKGDQNIYPPFETGNWKDGSSVPGYALVVGNRSDSYQYATNLTLNNVQIKVEEEADAGKYVYAYGNTNKTAGEPAYGATITYDAKCKLGNIVLGDEGLEGGSTVTINAPQS